MNKKLAIEEIRNQIKEIQNSLPAHSIPASMIIKLEDLEAELRGLEDETSGENNAET